MRQVVPRVVGWSPEGVEGALATLVAVRRSAPREPGAALAVSDRGEIVGSVTGGCVEPDLIANCEAILAGGEARLLRYGIADDEAFEIGLPCGGDVEIFAEPLASRVIADLAAALERDAPIAYVTTVAGPVLGDPRAVALDDDSDEIARAAQPLIAAGTSGLIETDDRQIFVHTLAPRPAMYVFGAIDFASAVARIGGFLGYRVTVCDPREVFLTPERFPDVDELVLEWPHHLLERAPIDERTAICVLTHDDKFDVPALRAALTSSAGYIGAMGSRLTTERRTERLLAEGIDEAELARIHAPIGLSIGSRSPEEVAVAVAAEIVSVMRKRQGVAREARASV